VIVNAEIWVDEANQINQWEKDLLRKDKLLAMREVRDEWGNLQQLWIKWEPVSDLGRSAPGDRHYTIDYTTGRVEFGDNHQGRIPPSSSFNNIEVRYWTGGGSQGNVAAGQINLLRNSLPYIDSVFNPRPACAGCDRETFDEVMQRGPQSIKHHGRAVTAEDFECMAREVSRNVSRVKCLPNTNWRGQQEAGCLTLVILPRGGRDAAITFPALKQEVENYLLPRISGNLLFPGKLQVIEPLYLEISVTAFLVTNSLDNLVKVENAARSKCSSVIQPTSYGRCWKYGD